MRRTKSPDLCFYFYFFIFLIIKVTGNIPNAKFVVAKDTNHIFLATFHCNSSKVNSTTTGTSFRVQVGVIKS